MSGWTEKSILLFIKLVCKRCYQHAAREKKDSPMGTTQRVPSKAASKARALTAVKGKSFFAVPDTTSPSLWADLRNDCSCTGNM